MARTSPCPTSESTAARVSRASCVFFSHSMIWRLASNTRSNQYTDILNNPHPRVDPLPGLLLPQHDLASGEEQRENQYTDILNNPHPESTPSRVFFSHSMIWRLARNTRSNQYTDILNNPHPRVNPHTRVNPHPRLLLAQHDLASGEEHTFKSVYRHFKQPPPPSQPPPGSSSRTAWSGVWRGTHVQISIQTF